MSQYIYSLIEELPSGAAPTLPTGTPLDQRPLPPIFQLPRATHISVWSQPIGVTGTLFITGGPQALGPNNQKDWPNPRGYAQPPSITTQTLNLQEFFPFVAPPAPFAQTDWPNPAPARRVVDLLTITRAPYVAPPAPSPFFQTDWPNPPQAARRSEPDLRFAASTPFPAAAKPFSQADWPLAPAGRPYPLDARTFVQAPLKNVGTVTLYLAATDAADTFAASIFSAQPVAPSAARPSVGLQTGGGGFSSSQKDIPWNTAKDIVRRWYEAIGFRWLEERTLSDMRPSERAYFMDTVQQSPQIQYLLQNGYTMPMIYTLINQVKADNIDDDDGEAIALLLD